MRQEILERIHQGHMGQNKCKARARRCVFWPGMNAEIAAMTQKCEVCRRHAYNQPAEPLIVRPPPEYPWYRVGVDLFQYGGKAYLTVYDALSNFPEIAELEDTSSATVIDKLGAIFARYGIPVEVCSDNGPQFAGREFRLFASKYDFQHVTSSPEFPRSNGLAEKGVQVVKRILKKTKEAGEDFWLGLLGYRSTPLEDGRSPGELLQGRRLRSTLPDFNAQTKVKVQKHTQFDHAKGPLPPLEEGQTVRIRRKRTWSQKAQVIAQTHPRSYKVLTQGNKLLRRNRQHLLPTKEVFNPDVLDYISDENVHQSKPSTPVRHGEDPTEPATAEASPVHPRRSSRPSRPPQRLQYDRNFNQML